MIDSKRRPVRTQHFAFGNRHRTLCLWLGLFLSAGCGGRQPPAATGRGDSDSRKTVETPYLNVRPEVKYVGDKACASCHLSIAQTYHHHPMGRSMAPAASVPERLDRAAGNPFEKLGVQFMVERRGANFVHKAMRRDAQGHTLADLHAEVQFTLGSGSNGKSYLINRDGYLYQSPISWYAQKQTWDLSPGFANFYPQQRGIAVDCLFCHANRVEPVEGSINHYREPIFQGYAIGCERCHGPGELHVAQRARAENVGDLDYTIVNPRHLEPHLRDAVCEQCHLQGEERVLRRGREPFAFRPGLPFYSFVSVFVRKPEWNQKNKAVGQVEQMYESRCYKASKAILGCISCHDPHDKPDGKKAVAHYRTACLQCHRESGAAGSETRAEREHKASGEMKPCMLDVAERKQTTPEDSCIVCHMPRSGSSDIVHTAVTDHRILRKPEPRGEDKPALGFQPGEIPVVHFHRQFVEADDSDVARDLGVTLMQLARSSPQSQVQLGKLALPILEKAVETWPDDLTAREALATALWAQGRGKEALAAYEAILEKAPGREQALLDTAALAEHFNQEEKAAALWKRVIAVNPWIADAHYRLAVHLAEQQRWQEAIIENQKAVKMNPTSVEQRVLLITCYIRSGQKGKAAKEFAEIEILGPRDLDVLHRWFADQTK
jgi:predicted CXXCH cytochrome family protein